MPLSTVPSVEHVIQLTSQLPKVLQRERPLSLDTLTGLKTALESTQPNDWLTFVEGRLPPGLLILANRLLIQGKTGLFENVIHHLYETAARYKRSSNWLKQMAGYILAVMVDLQQKLAEQLSNLVQQVSAIKLDRVRDLRRTYSNDRKVLLTKLGQLPENLKDDRRALLVELTYLVSEKIGGIDNVLFNRLKAKYPYFSDEGLKTIYERVQQIHQKPVEGLNLFERWFRRLTQKSGSPGYYVYQEPQ